MKRIALLFTLGALALPQAAAGQNVTGRATAVSVNTSLIGSQTFAGATLPAGGGIDDAGAETATVSNTLNAAGLKSLTTGQVDRTVVSVTATAEAADVNILNGLITVKAVLALATSHASGTTAASEANGSTVVDLVVGGVAYADGAPGPNTRVALPGVGYVVLNEQVRSGDGVRSSGLTVTMIHVYLVDQLSQTVTGEIVVGTATAATTL